MATLMEECETLREENRQLRQQLGLIGPTEKLVRCRDVFGLTRGQAEMLMALVRSGRTMSAEQLLDAAPSRDVVDERTAGLVHVQMVRVRRALRPHGIAIDSIRGLGFRLDEANRARVRELLQADATSTLREAS